MTLHLLKLAVGIESVEHLTEIQRKRRKERKARGERFELVHVTRMFPRRADEILAGGSIYWVIKGYVAARQHVLGLESVTSQDGVGRCAIVLGPRLYRTELQPRRPHQGWRYLRPEDAPRDLAKGGKAKDAPPHKMATALRDLGLL